jgi:hypothetical protein
MILAPPGGRASEFMRSVVLFVVAITIVQCVLALVGLFTPTLWGLSFLVFPAACPAAVSYERCAAGHDLHTTWSLAVWAAAAPLFALGTRRWSRRARIWGAMLAVVAVIGLMQAAILIRGYRFWVDVP